MMPAMSQGRTSPNVPLQTDCLSDSELEQREKMLRIAANPQTSSDLLRYLADSSDRLIRKTVVGNPNIPRDILFKLGSQFPETLVNNPVLDLFFLEDPNTFRDLPLTVQQHLLLKDDIPYYFMESIVKGGNINLCLGLIRHPKTPFAILNQLLKTAPNSVREAVKFHVKWPEPLQESIKEIVNTLLEQKSSQESTETTLLSLAQTGLLFDLMGRGNLGKNEKVDEVSHPSLWIRGLQNLTTPKNAKEIADDYQDENQMLQYILAELYQQFIPGLEPSTALLDRRLFPQKKSVKASVSLPQKNPKITNKIPQSGHAIFHVLESLACSRHTPHWLLYLLANANLWLRQKVLNNPHLPGSLLEKLAMDNNILVQRDVARHPNTPHSGLEVLALVQDSEVRYEVAKHPNTGAFELLLLATDPLVKIRREVAKNPQTPMQVLDLLSMDQDFVARLEVAKHSNTSLCSLYRLLNDYNAQVRSTALANSYMPIELIQKIISDTNCALKNKPSANFKFPLSVIKKLAMDPDHRVRQAIVNYRYLPSFLIHRLTQDTNPSIRYRAIHHPNVSLSMLKEVLCDRHLYKHSSKTYRVVAYNYLKLKPKSLPLVLKKIAEYSTDSFERLVVLLHPQILPSALTKNRQSLDWLERYCIAQHPNTPLCTLEELANDGNRVVRAVARDQLKQRQPPASTASD